VALRIFRAPDEEGGEPEFLDFNITRDEIHIDSVFHTVLADDIGYIRIAQFSEETGSELRAAIRDLQGQGVIALVLDLRWNSGGLLRQAIEVSDCFLPPGAMVVSTRGRISSQNRQYQSDHDALTDLPLVVLVNNASASASEIVAGALSARPPCRRSRSSAPRSMRAPILAPRPFG
jgi:carboxyl-terminal processing protease